jgi:response regulator RpfG family c-di-GMP phosphodiesterase
MRLLLVDDDPGLRALLRASFESFDAVVEEAESVTAAERALEGALPDAVVLDVMMPDGSGLDLCRRLKDDARTREVAVVLLTGAESGELGADAARADAVLRKPFSPLELLATVERLAGVAYGVPHRPARGEPAGEQLLQYARDLRHLLDVERAQREALQKAYADTVAALAAALETRDTHTLLHSRRVQRLALELTQEVDPSLAHDRSVEYGYLLHDIGKIGIPDGILLKPGPLTAPERRLMEKHTVLGEQIMSGVDLLVGEGLRVIRSHHERWDGKGYPDGRAGEEIPLAARIFAVADTVDAMTSNRPYRRALDWEAASAEVTRQCGTQFCPAIVDAFHAVEDRLRREDRAHGRRPSRLGQIGPTSTLRTGA